MADSPEADLPALIDRLWPDLRRVQMLGWAWIAAAAVAAAVAIYVLPPLGARPWVMVGVVLMLTAMAIDQMRKWTRRRHEAQIMPLLSRALEFDYDKFASGFLASLPRHLLPKAGISRAEDLITGTPGGRRLRFAEVVLETGGKNSSVIFGGIVAEYTSLAPLPQMFIADQNETTGQFLSAPRIATDDLVQVRALATPDGRHYGVWCRKADQANAAGFDETVRAILAVQQGLGPQSRLLSANVFNTTVHLAVSHQRDLFQIGGLMLARSDLAGALSAATRDLSVPLHVVSALLKAESDLAKPAKAGA